MLYQPNRHIEITTESWNEEIAIVAIKKILKLTVKNFSPDTFWASPEEESWINQPPTSIYMGAMGVLWVLDYLQEYLESDLEINKSELAAAIYEQYFSSEAEAFSKKDDSNKVVPSYFLGETGILLVHNKLNPGITDEIWEKQYQLIEGNVTNPTMEPLWGGPGTLIPALFKLETEPTERWMELFVCNCEFMKESVIEHEKFKCPIFKQDLYGELRTFTGAGHGFVGNMYPFIRGLKYLPQKLAEWALMDSVEMVIKTATIEGDCANWRTTLDGTDNDRLPYLIQWCHGAPGVVISLNNIPSGYSPEFDDLLIKAGETIWQAGPLEKGVNLCHGTDGNGFALLKLYKRTGDKKWLKRARAFAMHAIGQTKGRYSLWTGDLGLPCFLHACLTEDDRYPLLDIC